MSYPGAKLVGMCFKCDGYTDEQLDRGLKLRILIHGWAVQGVEPATPDGPSGGWAYTIGATENCGVPELIITDTNWDEAQHVLNWAISRLRDGDTLDDLIEDEVLWGPVHDAHLPSHLFNIYADHYRRLPDPGQFIQLFPSNRKHSAHFVKAASTDLSDPTQLPENAR